MSNAGFRFPWLSTFLLLAILLPATVSANESVSSGKPNIIMIMADDLGYEGLACYGNDTNKTPNLDRMAREGMRFTHAYATPLCTPTRVQLMTGKYNYRNYTGFGLLEKSETTFGDLMPKAGYVTAIAGKWQLLGNQEQRRNAGGKIGSYPPEVGFDNYCLWQVEQLGSRYKDPTITHTTGTQTYPGLYGPDIISDYALNFIEENRDKPFFLYYPMMLTHGPFEPTPDTPGFDTLEGKQSRDPARFKDMVEYMDKLVGKVVAKVDDLGLTTNTIIIFTGDNGTGKEIVSSVNGKKIQGAKGSPTRYGTNVPMIAYWPGTLKPGQVNENLIDFTDFLPTFMELANQPLPDGFVTDGVSFRKQLTGEKTTVRDHVYCYYLPNGEGGRKAIWAQNQSWKLYSDGRFFNVEKDPEELTPLSDDALTSAAETDKAALQTVLDKHASEGAK